MRSILFGLFCASLLLAPAMAQTAAPASPSPAAKKPVHSVDDLPRFTYPLAEAPSALLQADDATFAAFGAKVDADIDTVLAGYDIQDHATLRDLLAEKLDLELLSGTHDAEALQLAAEVRGLEDKPDAKLLSGLLVEAIVAARADAGATSGDAYLAAFRKHYAAELATLPWSVVGESLKETRTTFQLLTPPLILGQVQASIDPAYTKTGAVGNDIAGLIVRERYVIDVLIPLRMQGAAIIGDLVAKNTTVKPDIWAARDVTLSAKDKLTPVRVAVWDSGSDVTLFPHQLYTDPKPGPYDPHGLAFDLMSNKTHGDLMPLTPAQKQLYPSMIAFLTGLSDMEQSVDSPAADQVKKQIAALPQAQVATFFENLELISQYSHGTHVAGIALRGNPAARLVVARVTFDYKTIPTPPSVPLERRGAAADMAYATYFRTHHVRVVNMSWGGTLAGVETVLEQNGIGKDATEREALAQTYFAIDRAGLLAALKSAPDVLFVCAAGNADSNAGFDDTIPSSFELPNLLAVGAVDQAGDETSFTSYGKTVLVDADGFHVRSDVPGGTQVELSGTSMASPNVANLAAKLIAIDPKLTPEQTIALIRAGATPSADGRRHNIDPKRSIELLRKEEAALNRAASGRS